MGHPFGEMRRKSVCRTTHAPRGVSVRQGDATAPFDRILNIVGITLIWSLWTPQSPFRVTEISSRKMAASSAHGVDYSTESGQLA